MTSNNLEGRNWCIYITQHSECLPSKVKASSYLSDSMTTLRPFRMCKTLIHTKHSRTNTAGRNTLGHHQPMTSSQDGTTRLPNTARKLCDSRTAVGNTKTLKETQDWAK
jgi:hypothetical protein